MFTLPVTTLINSPPIILRRSYAQIDILLHDNITDKLFQKHSIKNAAFNKLLTRSKTKHLSTSPKHSKDSTNCFVANKPSREKRKPLKLTTHLRELFKIVKSLQTKLQVYFQEELWTNPVRSAWLPRQIQILCKFPTKSLCWNFI